MALQNGRLEESGLLASIGAGRHLELNAAMSWLRVQAAVQARYGWTPQPSPGVTAYRPLSIQERIFREYYTTIPLKRPSKVWNGQRWYQRPGYPQAATPGTSNHGWGLAVDVTGLGSFGSKRYVEFLNVAHEHGWDNNEGRGISEPWHMGYKLANDKHLTPPEPTRPPTPTTEVPLMRLITVRQDGNVFLVGPTLFQKVPDVPRLNSLRAIYGDPVVLDAADAQRIKQQVFDNITATAANLKGLGL